MLFALIATVSVLGFFVARAFTRKGIHRLPGGLSASVLVLIILKISLDIRVNPSSHNLLPFELVTWSVLGLVGYGLSEMAMDKWRKKHTKGDTH